MLLPSVTTRQALTFKGFFSTASPSPPQLHLLSQHHPVVIMHLQLQYMFFAVLILRSLITDRQTPSFRIRTFADLSNAVSLFRILGCVFDASLMPTLTSGRPPSIQEIKSIVTFDRDDRSWRDKWGICVVVITAILL